VKGGNVLVTRDGIVKLADFGASKAYRDATKTDAMKSMRGSVFWMAPEVIKGTGYGGYRGRCCGRRLARWLVCFLGV
jgi:mitogen-activated protein kinase kinase kinase